MPLNIQKNEEQSFQEQPKPEPILHTPRQNNHIASKTMGILFGAIVLAAVVFLLYTYGVIGGRKSSMNVTDRQQAQPEMNDRLADTAGGSLATAITEAQSSTQQKNPASHAFMSTAEGRYTVYIASYKARGDAEEEVNRWKEAGFESFVRDFDGGWFRVALGHYNRIGDAKSHAEELKDAFEQGYWIGPI
ncbi:MAG: SPOR domain-containing protein [Ignavibacteriae bacterium]|nr:SPOR domain-containing protein [Ignavibacteria bacterium]MBI3365244.1 SPOR domain-containing protein [Ignavibacteriota bacterium]